MGASTITLRGNLPDKQNPSPLELGAAGASVQNVGPRTVYYRDELPVTAFVNDGSIAANGSVSLSGTQYVVVDEGAAASQQDVATLLINPVAQTSGNSGAGLTPTSVKTAAYTAVAGELVRADTSAGALTITLPAATDGARVGIKLTTAGLPLTIAAGGSDVFNKTGGAASLLLTLLNQGVVLSGKAGVWVVESTDAPLSVLDSRYRAIGSVGSIPKGVASRCLVIAQSSPGTGSIAGESIISDHKILANCDNIRVWFSNCLGGGRGNVTTSIWVQGEIEDAGGGWHRMTFNGAYERELKPQETVACDPIGIGFDNGNRTRVQTFVKTLADGDPVPAYYTLRGSPYRDGKVAGNKVGLFSSTTYVTDGSYHFAPVAITADYSDASTFVVVGGDSIAAGQNDGTTNVDKVGFVLRALNDQFPYMNLAIPGDSAKAFKPPIAGAAYTSRKARMPLLNGNVFIDNDFVNDLSSGSSDSIKDSKLRVARASAMRGMKVFLTTCTPVVSGTADTLANQTVNPNETKRTDFNDWARDGCPIDPATKAPVAIGTAGALRTKYIAWNGTAFVKTGTVSVGHPVTGGIFEIADLVESARNSGKWRVDQGTISDTVHPTSVGANMMAAGIDLTELGDPAPGATVPVSYPNPATISNLHTWLKADAITGKADGDTLSSWPDSSGNSRDAAQATSGNRPVFKTNINFGMPAVRFDGIDDFMRTAVFGALTQPFEIFMVAKLRSATSHGYTPFFLSGQDGSTFGIRYGAGAAPQQITLNAGTNLSTGFISTPTSGWHAYDALFKGASTVLLEDGTSLVSGDAGAGSLSQLTIGGNAGSASPADIDVHEIILYSKELTSTERATVRGYLKDKYALP